MKATDAKRLAQLQASLMAEALDEMSGNRMPKEKTVWVSAWFNYGRLGCYKYHGVSQLAAVKLAKVEFLAEWIAEGIQMSKHNGVLREIEVAILRS